jgi:hypothetical protein
MQRFPKGEEKAEAESAGFTGGVDDRGEKFKRMRDPRICTGTGKGVIKIHQQKRQKANDVQFRAIVPSRDGQRSGVPALK